ncbi:YegS/Rv2252/BmrU family lipid kinase [Luteococcus sp. OSA5]|uniref:YegS/Rv2252/BmrU family lipid kinase n=1 Tax=Luteococcus sp. OSA5 TaxID=3401630 RepID=UPI003B43C64B
MLARLVDRFRRHFAQTTLVVSLVALTAWTLGTFATDWLAPLDRVAARQHLTPGSPAAQVWEAIAVVTLPGLLAVLMVAVAAWAWRRRLRNLSMALLLSVSLAWASANLLKLLLGRPRPDSPFDVITAHGSSYPSSHVTMATTVALMVVATTTTTRQPVDSRYLWRLVGVLGVLTISADRIVMNAHWPTDVVAGFLLGLVCASLACLACRVHMLPLPPRHRVDGRPRTCAVIWNPSKVLDRASFRRTLEYELEARGWADALWLSTRPDDPGYAMAREALERDVDMVVVAGGDGTVRVVCSELANSGIPVGIIPAGTGNLLARNLEIPLDEVAAARVAFNGKPRPIDLVRVRIDGEQSTEHFAVMAGIGIDARIMQNTRPELKKMVGSAAYFLAAAQELSAEPMDLTFQADDGPVQHRRAMMAVVGNVGMLQGGIQLLPNARPNDGLLDLIVASPRGYVDMATMTARFLGRRGTVDGVDQVQARRVRLEVAQQMPYELDGDSGGRTTVFEAEVAPGALLVMQH